MRFSQRLERLEAASEEGGHRLDCSGLSNDDLRRIRNLLRKADGNTERLSIGEQEELKELWRRVGE